MRKKLSVVFGMATLVFAIIGVALLSSEQDLAILTNNSRGKVLEDAQAGIKETKSIEVRNNIYKFSDVYHNTNG